MSPDRVSAYIRASESAKPGERLHRMEVYLIKVGNPPVLGLISGFGHISRLWG